MINIKEVEVAKNIILNNLSTNQNTENLRNIFEIRSNNKEILLEHINALINIFTRAKETLELELENEEKDYENKNN